MNRGFVLVVSPGSTKPSPRPLVAVSRTSFRLGSSRVPARAGRALLAPYTYPWAGVKRSLIAGNAVFGLTYRTPPRGNRLPNQKFGHFPLSSRGLRSEEHTS